MVISYYLSASDKHVRVCNNVRIIYTKTRSRFPHYRICGKFFSLLMSDAASQAKLQSLQLYCICMCQVNSTTGSDGWLQQCVATPSLHVAGGGFVSFKRKTGENEGQSKRKMDFPFPWCSLLSSQAGIFPLSPFVRGPGSPQ